MKNNQGYSVKYLGVVEGSVGCLSRKLPMPVKVDDKLHSVSKQNLKSY